MAKKIIIALLFVLLTIASFSQQQYKNAIGLRYGSVSNVGGAALSYKHFISSKAAIEGILSFREPVAIGALYQVHQPITSVENLNWYYGGGGYVSFPKSTVGIGLMGNIGLDYKFEAVPINLSLDFKPEFALAPNAGIDFNTFGFSIRYVIK